MAVVEALESLAIPSLIYSYPLLLVLVLLFYYPVNESGVNEKMGPRKIGKIDRKSGKIRWGVWRAKMCVYA